MRTFLFTTNKIDASSYLWNAVSSIVLALQSVVMLIIVTHVIGLIQAGILTIAFANANLMHLIGKWGMRNYQVSDSSDRFSFADYLNSRWFCSLLMISVSACQIAISTLQNGYSTNKILILSFMCIYKVIDAIEDVYTAFYQKNGRLDVGAKCMAIRLSISLIIFAGLTLVTKDILLSLIISTCVSAFILVILIKYTLPYFPCEHTFIPIGDALKRMGNLLLECAPIFAGSFLQFYIGNAPRYAIDSIMNDQSQAIYGFLSMPIFVIGLFAGFIFNPVLQKMSVMWKCGANKSFTKGILKQLLYIVLISVAVFIVGFFIGIPVLSFLYNTDLRSYLFEFLLLLAAGGLLAVTAFLVIILTIIRLQKLVVIGYSITAIFAFFLSSPVIRNAGMMGAAFFYLALMSGTTLIFAAFVIFGLRKHNNNNNNA